MTEVFTALFIHLRVPLAGILAYGLLCRKLLQQGAPIDFLGQLFIIFFCWGGLLIVTLTSLFWQWSGMASLGFGFLLFIAPFVVGGVAFHLARLSQPTVAQRRAMWACLGYYGAMALLIAVAVISR